jgi:hypothetical protein
MAGSPTNASLWPDADVYVGALDATNPTDADTAFDSDWDFVGLLDGDAGFGNSREEEKTDLFAWGGILVRTSRRNFKMSRTFTLLEDNDVTRELIWPGSSATELFVPRPQRIKIAFEVREGDRVQRLISTDVGADVEVDGDYSDTESDLTRYPMRATIYPDPNTVSTVTGAALLFVRQDNAPASS